MSNICWHQAVCYVTQQTERMLINARVNVCSVLGKLYQQHCDVWNLMLSKWEICVIEAFFSTIKSWFKLKCWEHELLFKCRGTSAMRMILFLSGQMIWSTWERTLSQVRSWVRRLFCKHNVTIVIILNVMIYLNSKKIKMVYVIWDQLFYKENVTGWKNMREKPKVH